MNRNTFFKVLAALGLGAKAQQHTPSAPEVRTLDVPWIDAPVRVGTWTLGPKAADAIVDYDEIRLVP